MIKEYILGEPGDDMELIGRELAESLAGTDPRFEMTRVLENSPAGARGDDSSLHRAFPNNVRRPSDFLK
jgi:hypothetical protein